MFDCVCDHGCLGVGSAATVAKHHSGLIDQLLMTVVQGQNARSELEKLGSQQTGTDVLAEHMSNRVPKDMLRD